MDCSVHRAALAAAARVALAGLVAGCGGSSAIDDGSGATADAGGSPDGATPVDSSVATDAVPDAPAACEGTTLDAASMVSLATFDCCLAAVGSYFPDGGFATELPAAAANDPRTPACCASIVAFVDGAQAADASTTAYSDASANGVLAACCNSLGNPMGVACTPWGPPVPPELPASLVA